MPTMEDSAAKPNLEVKQLQRYYTVLRDFMAHRDGRGEIYPPSHEFTQDELGSITPGDIVKWMNVKLYNKEDPGAEDPPLNGSHHTLDYYKKSISYFMPQKDESWDSETKTGNPTRSPSVNKLIRRIRQFDQEAGGAKKRKSSAKTTGSPKKSRASLPAKFAPMIPPPQSIATAIPPQGGATVQGMQHILRRMQAQNASFIDLAGALSQSCEMFKSTLQAHNQAINADIESLKKMTLPGLAPAIPNAARPVGVPKSSVAAGSVGAGMLDWQYVHPDGVRRRVPPTWTFPHDSLQEMYILWHCGDYRNRISPMKLFQGSDVGFLGKRSKMNLNEVKNLMKIVDEEATKKGNKPAGAMTIGEAMKAFQSGLSGFDFHSTTPTGKQRDVARLKWSTLTKYKTSTSPKKKAKPYDAETAKAEFLAEEDDQYWYEHGDGKKRRVPSSWQFPMLGLEDMYVYWHCGDKERKISPMKRFTGSDINLLQKRCKTNLSEVRAVMTIIDLEAKKKGKTISSGMTPDEAKECCAVGYLGLKIPKTTADGRPRDILKMKWSSAVKLKKAKSGNDSDDVEAEEVELPEAEVDV
ncbi:hypothetical protein ACHAXT_000956 [Thalassiosira profunda]